MSPELLSRIGVALYGPRWTADLARDLHLGDRHMRRLAAGTATIHAGIWRDLKRLCDQRAADLAAISAQISQSGLDA